MKQLPLAVSIVSLMSLPAWAATAPEVEQVVITGSYSASEYDPLTSRVTVLDRTTISSSGKTSVLELLRSVPGLSVRQAGGPGGMSEINIRGSEANFTLVLVDGVRVNDSNNTRGGGFNFNSIDLNMVERIEVIRGAQTATYGGDALAGVIQIFTKPALGEGVSQRAAVSLAEDGYYTAHYGVFYKNDTVEADLNAAALDRGDDVPFSGYDNTQISGGVVWQLTPAHSLSARVRILDDSREYLPEQSGGDQFATTYALEQTDSEELAGVLEWQAQFNDMWHSRVQWQRFERDFTQDSPGIAPYFAVPPNFNDTDYTSTDLLWVNTLGNQSLWVNLGVNLIQEDGDSEGNIAGFLDTSFALKRDNSALFAEFNYLSAQDLTAKLSARHEEPEDLDAEQSYAAELAIPFASIFSVTAAWADGFKVPSFFALGHPLVGNPDLKPERATTWDLRLSVAPNENLIASIAYFDNAFEDLIDFDPEAFTNVNRAQVDITGFEVSVNWQILNELSMDVFASFSDIDTHEEGVELSGRPEEQYGVSLNWAPLTQHAFGLSAKRTGEQFDTSLYSGDTVRYTLDAYNLVDLNYTYKATDNLQLELAIDNLLDEEYMEFYGFSAQDRRARLTARVTF